MRTLKVVLTLALLTVAFAWIAIPAETESIDLPGLGKVTTSGPYRYESLAVYLLHGKDASDVDVTFLSLSDALAQKKVVVKETGSVNQLVVKNVSADHVFIQAGDIVKGGKQDRLIAHDLLLPPRSGKVPLGAFCVEQGRWSGRGTESVAAFASAVNRAAGSGMKLAYRKEKSQQRVWAKVKETQSSLEEAVAVEVRDSASPTSLELSLDSDAVKRAVEAYETALGKAVGKHDDTVGVIALIDGEVRGANVYAWHALFAAVWPRILSELAADAVASGQNGDKAVALSPEELRALLVPAAGTKEKTVEIVPGVTENQASYGDSIRFVSKDDKLGWTRAEVLKKD